MVPVGLCAAKLELATADLVLSELARRLLAAGHVKGSFEAAALKREKRSPTGLPFSPVAVALPHAEPEHVAHAGIALATLAKPVRFRQMGSPQTSLDVQLVVMPALSSKEQAAASLSKLIEMLQDAGLRQALVAAPTAEMLSATLAGAITATLGERWSL